MTTALAARLQKVLVSLWAQLDVEKGCLPSKSCRWLLDELKELQELRVPASYASSAFPLAEAVNMLQATPASPIASLPLASATYLAALLAQALNCLAAPLPPSTACDPLRPTLPSEIISLILHQLAPAKRTSDVAACCLVSKSFLPLAREVLYHTLNLEIVDQECEEDGTPLDLPTSARRGSDLAINYGRLASSLSRHPHLGSLVRELNVFFRSYDNTMDHVSALDVFRALLDACRPQHITLDGAAPIEASHFARVLWESRQRFRSLHLGPFEVKERPGSIDAALWRLLQEQEVLEVLSLEFDETIDIPLTLPWKLKQLSLHGPSDIAIAPRLDSFIHYSPSTLTRLSFPFDLSAEASTIPRLSHFLHLQSVQFHLSCSDPPNGPEESPERGRCRGLFAALPPSVQSITLRDSFSDSLPLCVRLVCLPPTLLFLNTRTICFSPASLLTFLRSPSASRLRRFKYITMEPRDEDSEEWTNASKAEVESLLEELGIEGN
ncbi:hypothetical protein BCR35DRAFT_353191 [Leucosporidium creatinivorum]|uniref:Uncharacterized protein n=1 Tax=Leucosporidium creatinivorum TaxID=106004 RepID=A0A1Y2F044_9BASI|nr:hypothetical protein BCR35DRAFT_353191 [Leucosporidium creatinivorum]